MIRTNNDLYEWQVTLLLDDAPSLEDEVLLNRIEDIAELAFHSGPELLADPRLDRLLIEMARRIQPLPSTPSAPLAHRPRRVLHVTTDLHHVGGHTRIILNWIQADRETHYDLVSTNQRGHITEWMRETLAAAGCELICMKPEQTRLDRARQLRERVMHEGYDLVVLHHYPWDTVALTALGVEGLPQVFIFNQGDHVYWLGVPLADAVLDFRPRGAEVSVRVRGAARSLHLPYVLEPQLAEPARAVAREQAGLTGWQTVMVSMARIQKFVPCKDYNLHRTLAPVMRRHPKAVLLLIGVTMAEYLALFGEVPPPNVKPLGNISQPTILLRAADVFIEPMPWGTALATFDACRYGVVPIFVYGLAPCIYGCAVRDLFTGSGMEQATESEAEYVTLLERLLIDADHRSEQGRKVAAFCEGTFQAPQWNEHLERVYAAAVGGRHLVREPGTVYYERSAAFKNYGNALSEDLAAHMSWCMNRLGAVRPVAALRLGIAFLMLRIAVPRIAGMRTLLRFLVASFRRGCIRFVR